MVKKKHFDLGIIVPLEEELEQVFEVFSSKQDLSTDTLQVHAVNTGSSKVSAVVVKCPEMGRSAARTAAQHCLQRFDVSLLVCVGIAGGLSKDLALGDVCYSTEIIEISENQKISDAAGGGVDLALSTKTYHTDEKITFAVSCSRTQPQFTRKYRTWRDKQNEMAQSLKIGSIDGGRGNEEVSAPISLHGPIACGAVSNSQAYNELLSNIHRNVLAIETESGEIFVEAKLSGVPALTIRGVSDYANAKKSGLEKGTKGSIRAIAASNAASFLKLQIQNPFFLAQLQRQRSGEQRDFDFDSSIDADVSLIDQSIKELSDEIDSELRELSPEYRLQEKGYRLPAPRLRSVNLASTNEAMEPSQPESIESVLASEKQVSITLPRSYPDKSVPWVFALELLTTIIHEKQVVPIVIDGSQISPPRNTLARLGGTPLKVFESRESFKTVFLIENPPIASKTKLKFLQDELSKYEESSVVFIFNRSERAIERADFLSAHQVSNFETCEISFLQIAHFLERNHDMQAAEAQVVALRLRDIFDRFALDAHPTYFAGIAKELLTSLLAANRRSELIQLAVDGFLTFLVAGDPAQVALSRTTRAKFLKELAFQTRVEKRKMSRANTVAYAEDFAQKYDYEIDPLAFVREFEDRGIISFENSGAEFILPFVEHYLLAQKLRETPESAMMYFNSSIEEFDLATFDLYAEMGPSLNVRQDILQKIDEAEAQLAKFEQEEHILLTNELQPAVLSAMERVTRMEKTLQSASEAVKTDKDVGGEKQRLLDMRERVHTSLATHAEKETTEAENKAEIEQVIRSSFRSWHVGVTLLGSGSEHLEADEKRTLVARLLTVGSKILDVWTRQRADFDLEEFRQEITSDDSIDFFVASSTNKPDRKQVKDSLNGIVDMVEGVLLAQPSQVIYDTLCERAREKVLSVSIDAVEASNDIEQLMQALWLADIDTGRARSRLAGIGRDLPAYSFLRMTVAMHCMMRTFWRHWCPSSDNLRQMAA